MKGTNVKDQLPEGNGHVTYEELAHCSTGSLSAEQAQRLRQHCLECAACREQLTLVMQSLQSDNPIEQDPDYAKLLRAGELAAEKVLSQQTVAAARATPTGEREQELPPRKKSAWSDPLTEWLPFPRWLAAAAVAALVLALPLGLHWQRKRPVERAMVSLRSAWTVNRPLESRITGDFPPLPYERVRSANRQTPNVPTNQDQLLAAEAELKRAVADHGSPGARHALARFYLLKLEFEPAEEQLQQVLKAEPNNAAAHVDLAALYYERWMAEQAYSVLMQASQESDKAIASAPKLPEAWFNRALIHEEMKLPTEAQKDWERYLELDATSKWAEEARSRLQKLRQRAVLQEPQPDKIAAELRTAKAEKNEAALHRLLEERFTEVSELMAGRLLDEYLKAAIEGKQPEATQQHQLLRHLAQLIQETKGDYYFVDLLRFMDNSPPTRLEKIRAVREQLQQGQAQYQAGRHKQAIELASAAKSAAESLGDVCHTEAALCVLARIYTPQTETKKMSLLRTRLLSETTRHDHLQMKAKALLALSNQYGAERKFSRWLETSLQAKEIASQVKDLDLTALSLRDIGFAYSDLGEYEQGIKAHYSATQNLYIGTLNLRRACQTYVQFARLLADQEHYQEAQAYQREALPFCQRCSPGLYLPAVGRAGKYAALAGQTNESLRLFQQALPETERYSQATGAQDLLVDLYLSLGDALVKNQRFSEAESAYGQAGEKLGQLKNLYYLSAIQRGLATALLPQGKMQDAEAALIKSIELTKLSRLNISAAGKRSTFVNSRLNLYQSMVDFQYFYKHSLESAFDFSEIYRNRELLDLLAHAQETSWEENKRDLQLATSTTPLTLRQIQMKLPADTQLVEYALTEKHLLIWIVDRERWLAKDVAVTPAQLQTLVAEYLHAVREQHALTEISAQAKELYRMLIQPVAEHLKLQQNLVIIPDGVLNSLPFAALVNPDSQRYLLEDYTLILNPSASILVELLARSQAARPKPVKSVLAVSNPEFDHRLFPKLTRLPGAGEEIREIRSLYASCEQLAGTQATKEALLRMADNFDVLHLATHSVVNAREPLFSAIVLAAEKRAQATQPESLLLAHEIFRLRLPQTRLVILSSCNSLVNQQAGQNGLGGLAHAFFSAGVPTVIGSLWEVKDESTASLLAAFHQNWRRAGLNTGQALRQAQLAFLHSSKESWRHPIHWAAFHVSGNGITI